VSWHLVTDSKAPSREGGYIELQYDGTWLLHVTGRTVIVNNTEVGQPCKNMPDPHSGSHVVVCCKIQVACCSQLLLVSLQCMLSHISCAVFMIWRVATVMHNIIRGGFF
jgi:hypothetical protein